MLFTFIDNTFINWSNAKLYQLESVEKSKLLKVNVVKTK
jgi:hypothetical protein